MPPTELQDSSKASRGGRAQKLIDEMPPVADKPDWSVEPTTTAPPFEVVPAVQKLPPAADFREAAMLAPVEVMKQGLAEYDERRKTFRDWLLAKMQPGVHFGFQPGCEPRLDANDNIIDRKGHVVPKGQWQAKPSLYKAGAELVVDVMRVRDEYEVDEGLWKQLGGKVGMLVYRCVLRSRETGAILGEGRGAFSVGEKSMEGNAAIKMGKKRSLVDAVLSTYALSDLFTQDLEDMQPPKVENPEHNAAAPKTPPRAARPPMRSADDQETLKKDVLAVLADWKISKGIPADAPATPEQIKEWSDFVQAASKRKFNVTKFSAWTAIDVELCREALSEVFQR